MRLIYYNYLIHLVEAGSLSKAASMLYITPQGLSKGLHQLEDLLGVALFYRDKTGLNLTQAGKEVYDFAKRFIALDHNLKEQLGSYSDGPQNDNRLANSTIYSTPHCNVSFLQSVMNTFYLQNSNINIKLIEMHPHDIVSLQRCPKDTLMFFSVPEPMMESYIELLEDRSSFVELFRAQIMICCSRYSALSDYKTLSINDMKAYSLAMFSSEIFCAKELFGEKLGSKTDITISNNNLLRQVIAWDKNLIGLTDSLIEYYIKSPLLVTIPLYPKVNTVYGYIFPKEIKENNTLRNLLSLIHNEFKNIQAAYLSNT